MMTTVEQSFGGFWRRFWAYSIDVYAVLGFLVPLYYLGYAISRDVALVVLLSGILTPLYFIYFHYRWGQSVGKIILGLKVISQDGNAMSLQQATFRYVIDLIFAIVFLVFAATVLLEISGEEFSRMTFQERSFLFVGRSFWILIGVSLIWLLLNALTLQLNTQKRSLRDFLAATRVVLTDVRATDYPKKKIATSLVLAAAGQMLMSKAFRSGFEWGMLLGVLGTGCYMFLFLALVDYVREARRSPSTT